MKKEKKFILKLQKEIDRHIVEARQQKSQCSQGTSVYYKWHYALESYEGMADWVESYLATHKMKKRILPMGKSRTGARKTK